MADDKKNTPDVAPPTEAPSPTAEVAAVPATLLVVGNGLRLLRK